MATDLRSAPTTRHAQFVDQMLERARRRVRALDTATALLGLVGLSLLYAVGMALCDRWLDLPALIRQAALVFYLLAAACYLVYTVVLPWSRRLNPYYLAQQLEQTLPQAKNSVVNWLDLRQQPLPPVVQTALSHKAARDLAQVDLEQAVSASRLFRVGALVGVVLLAMFVFYLSGPRQFLSLLGRAFAPFGDREILSRTSLTLVRPEGGETTVPVGRAVSFAVLVEGRVPAPDRPDALRLLYRYGLDDPYQERRLEWIEPEGLWGTMIPASQVRNGFWYKVTGGDAETPEYRVRVRSAPLFTGFEVTYQYPPYIGWPEETNQDPNLRAPRGTRVALVARTNRTVQSGQLTRDKSPPLTAERVAEDPQALRFRLELLEEDTYRLWFNTADGERNRDPLPYSIRILRDQPPQVELHKPGQDIKLPANGVLRLEGRVSDDFGVARVALRMKLVAGPELPPKPYRNGKSLRLPNGMLPQMLEYRDFVDLASLQTADREPVVLRTDSVLEYWLEAADGCDLPDQTANVSESQRYRVYIQEPEQDPAKTEQERQQARQEQQQHEAAQDQASEKQAPEQAPKPENQTHKDQPQPGKQEQPQTPEEKLREQAEKLEQALKETTKQQNSQQKDGQQGDQEQKDGSRERSDEQQSGQRESKPHDASAKQGEPQPKDGSRRDGEQHQSEAGKGEQQQAQQSGTDKGEPKPGDQGSQNEPKPGDQNNAQSNPRPGEETPEKTRLESGDAGKPGNRQVPKEDSLKKVEPGASNDEADKAETRPGERQSQKADHKPSTQDGPKETRPSGEQGDKSESKSSHAPAEKPEPQPEQGEGDKKQTGGEKGSGEKTEPQPGKPEETPQAGQNSDSGRSGKVEPKRGAEPGEEEPTKSSGNGAEKAEPKAGERPAEKAASQTVKDADKGEKEQGKQAGGEKTADSESGGKSAGADNSAADSKTEQPEQAQPKTGEGTGQKDRTDRGQPKSGDKGKAKQPGSQPGQERLEKRDSRSPDETDQGEPRPGQTDQSKKKSGQGKQGPQTGQSDRSEQRPGQGKEGPQPTDKTGTEQRKPDREGPESGEFQDKKPRLQAGDRDSEQAEPRPGAEQGEKADSQPQAGNKPGMPKKSGEHDKSDAGEKSSNNAAEKPGQKSGSARPENGKPKPGSNQNADSEEQRPGEGGTPQPGGRTSTPSKPEETADVPGRDGANTAGKPRATPPGAGTDNRAAPVNEEVGTEANPEHQKRAAMLQLEDFKKRVTKDVLKKANMTEQEYRDFLKAYEELLNKQAATPGDNETLAAPQRGGGTLPNAGLRQVKPGSGTADQLRRAGPALPPPEFRELHKEFSRRLSELERVRGKK